ncbi:type I secretion C-terminal target domain-containing protein [Roseospirillum parvum]|uniref:Type I secretion C-terminal target domain (VC_A0849 subclass) n=1 Tax=Roseospirillum parvum TaxID=83401 RepID=A0A1G7V9F5_9PROT|nr:type I secretion C-terminal target domain-containing protein [Roseospirillum parvum]SDG56426.1 type I secretion C-terminal target domain (VC_A0849 subclass) [Roseospirillum parvum]
MTDTPSSAPQTPAGPTDSQATPELAPELAQATPEDLGAVLEGGAGLTVTETVALPGAGQRAVVPATFGTTYAIAADQVSFAQEGPSLVVSTEQGEVVLQDFFVLADTGLPPALSLADGAVITIDDVIAAIPGFDADAVATAAGGGAGGGGGGAAFAAFDPGALGDGLEQLDLLDNLDLAFTPPQNVDEEVTPTGDAEVEDLTDAPESTTQLLTVTNFDGEAGYHNTFGYYVKDADGNPTSGQIIWADASNDNFGAVFQLAGYSQDQIGFFIIPDGERKNSRNDDLVDGARIEFVEMDGRFVATLNGEPLDGFDRRNMAGEGTTYPFVLFDNPGLNEGYEFRVGGGTDYNNDDQVGGGKSREDFINDLLLEDFAGTGQPMATPSTWEDLTDGGDRDFSDVQVTITWTDAGDPETLGRVIEQGEETIYSFLEQIAQTFSQQEEGARQLRQTCEESVPRTQIVGLIPEVDYGTDAPVGDGLSFARAVDGQPTNLLVPFAEGAPVILRWVDATTLKGVVDLTLSPDGEGAPTSLSIDAFTIELNGDGTYTFTLQAPVLPADFFADEEGYGQMVEGYLPSFVDLDIEDAILATDASGQTLAIDFSLRIGGGELFEEYGSTPIGLDDVVLSGTTEGYDVVMGDLYSRDTLEGGAGPDTFVVGFGDTVADFNAAEGDRLDLDALFEALDPGFDPEGGVQFTAGFNEATGVVTIDTLDKGCADASFTVEGMTDADFAAMVQANQNVDNPIG